MVTKEWVIIATIFTMNHIDGGKGYARRFQLEEPLATFDSAQTLLRARFGWKADAAASHWLKLFREGEFGWYMLDAITGG
jgi:hypothetical protein